MNERDYAGSSFNQTKKTDRCASAGERSPKISTMNGSKENKSSRIVAIVAAIACVLIGCVVVYKHELIARKTAADPVVAVVNNTLIHKSDLSALSPPLPAQHALALLVDFRLIDLAAKEKNISISDAELQQERQTVIENQNATTYAVAAQMLGSTPSGLDLQLRHALLLKKLSALEIKSDPSGMFHARGILISSNGKHAKSDAQALEYAQKVQREIAAGADIQALAKQDSDDFISAPNGGDLGITQLSGAPNLVRFMPDFRLQKVLASAVNTAKPGSFLGSPIKGDFGYWVIEVTSTDREPNGDTALYRQVDAEWRSLWINRLEPGVMARLRNSAFIEPSIAEPSPQNHS
jgi:parvulin-like peptidyl-prolyl isomerase